MSKISPTVTLFLLLTGAGGAEAQTAVAASQAAVPQEVVKRHIALMQAGRADAAADDYADDAVLVTPPGAIPGERASVEPAVAVGSASIRKFLVSLVDKEHYPAIKGMVSHLESRPAGVTLMYWSQWKGTPQQVDGLDVFVVKNGKIAFQTITLTPKK